IGSVNYRIWECPACGEHKKKRGSTFSRYQACPECGAKTLGSTSTTLETATEYRYGSVEIRQACENCSYKNTYTQTTPMLEDTSTSTSSAAAASSALLSSSSISDAGSASSNSGFSGGDSSGGGASGSW
ncbi:MAG TPA: hypothetical protein VGG20_28155, partial [Thermoanaerobaculia bacterium]